MSREQEAPVTMHVTASVNKVMFNRHDHPIVRSNTYIGILLNRSVLLNNELWPESDRT